MAVYVDKLFNCERRPDWCWPYACHMYADTLEELHAMADKLCMKRNWFQDRPYFPHYDLTPTLRSRAIHYGAVESTRKQSCDYRHKLREAAEAAGGK